jgi:hypothetical protein
MMKMIWSSSAPRKRLVRDCKLSNRILPVTSPPSTPSPSFPSSPTHPSPKTNPPRKTAAVERSSSVFQSRYEYFLPSSTHQVLLSIMYLHQRRVFLFGCCSPVVFGVELHERLASCHFINQTQHSCHRTIIIALSTTI